MELILVSSYALKPINFVISTKNRGKLPLISILALDPFKGLPCSFVMGFLKKLCF